MSDTKTCCVCDKAIKEVAGRWYHTERTAASLDHKAVPRCPRCDGPVPNGLFPGQYPGALSRVDNKTEICSQCGMDEAMWQFTNHDQPLPPIEQPVWWVDERGDDGDDGHPQEVPC